MQQLEWIFFDIGGVLADESAYQQYRQEACLDIAGKYVSGLTPTDFTTAFAKAGLSQGSLTEHTLEILLEQGGQQAHASEALAELRATFRTGPTYLELEVVRPEAAEVVRKLAAHYRIGIIANQVEGIKQKLDQAGVLEHLADCTVAPDHLGKPNLEYYRQVLQKNQANPAASLMVDDNYTRGVLPAKRVGMQTLWFGGTLPAEGVDMAADNLEAVVAQLLG
jgi:HAD superfamily hydrolase (TIGR01509 family)